MHVKDVCLAFSELDNNFQLNVFEYSQFCEAFIRDDLCSYQYVDLKSAISSFLIRNLARHFPTFHLEKALEEIFWGTETDIDRSLLHI